MKETSYVVKLREPHSHPISITMGTAQGSVLGPLHYLSYVNDVSNIISKFFFYRFADDTCIISADRDVTIAESKLQHDFLSICKWSHDMGLISNAQKTKMMHIHSSHNKPNRYARLVAHSHDCLHTDQTNCTCEPIERDSQQTYLGLIIEDRLNWGSHIETLTNKLRANLARFYAIKT
ncbi:hypothetical protein ABMA27_016859 [Loxostege sticticalis]|uniref:Reverse transcriptase domain-containing protein n=1 Tax=Loxostege sticticalis TaxID=481309 RepID=A0ABR3I3W3_LOXSC